MFVWGVKRMPGSGVGRAPHGVKKYPEDQARRYTFRRPSRGVCTSGGLPCLSLCRTETVRRRACFKRPWAVCGEALVLVTGGRHKGVLWKPAGIFQSFRNFLGCAAFLETKAERLVLRDTRNRCALPMKPGWQQSASLHRFRGNASVRRARAGAVFRRGIRPMG